MNKIKHILYLSTLTIVGCGEEPIRIIEVGETTQNISTFAITDIYSDLDCDPLISDDCPKQPPPSLCPSLYGGPTVAIIKVGMRDQSTKQVTTNPIDNLVWLFDITYTQKVQTVAVIEGQALPEYFEAMTKCSQFENTTGEMIVTIDKYQDTYFIISCKDIDLTPDGEHEYPPNNINLDDISRSTLLPNNFEDLQIASQAVLSDYSGICERTNLQDEPNYDPKQILEDFEYCK